MAINTFGGIPRVGDRPPLGLRYSTGPTPFSPGWTDFWHNQLRGLRGGTTTPPLGLRNPAAVDATTPAVHPAVAAAAGMHPLLAHGGTLGRGGAGGYYGYHHTPAAIGGIAPGTPPAAAIPPAAVPPAALGGGPPAHIGPPAWSPYLLGFMQGLGGA